MFKNAQRPRILSVVLFLLGSLAVPVSGQDLELVSSRRGTLGQTAANDDSVGLSISANGQVVVYWSDATDLVTGVTDSVDTFDLFLYDTVAKSNSLVSRNVTTPTLPANDVTKGPATVSADGRWVAFVSKASDLITGTDANVVLDDVFLFDRMSGSMTLVSHALGAATTTGNGVSTNPIVSADGRYVAFESHASDLVASDGNGKKDIFLFDRIGGAITLVSRKQGTPDTTANGVSELGSISADGAFVVFESEALDIGNVVIDVNLERDVFLFARDSGAVTLVSHTAANPQATAADSSTNPRISADGDWVVYQNAQPAVIVDGITDGNGPFVMDVLLWRRQTDETVLVDRSSSAATTGGNADATLPQLSDDGRYVAFTSTATDLVSGQVDDNEALGSCCNDDVFLWDRVTGGMTLVSRSAGSATTTADNGTRLFTLSGDGRSVAFSNNATNVVSGQTGGVGNVFLFHASAGEVELASHTAGSPETTAGGSDPRLSRLGSLIFNSGSSNLGFTDSNAASDVIALLPVIFGDGFESGSTSAWSSEVP